MQTKVIDNVIAKKFPTLRKGGTSMDRKFTKHQTIKTRKETAPDIL
jgi:hypothetical protein